MPSEIKEFFTAAEALTPKAECAEYAYKLFNSSKGVSDVFNSQYNKIYLSDDYDIFLKQQNMYYLHVLENLIEGQDLTLKK